MAAQFGIRAADGCTGDDGLICGDQGDLHSRAEGELGDAAERGHHGGGHG